MDLSDRVKHQVGGIYEEVESAADSLSIGTLPDLEAIIQKENELTALESLLQEKLLEADNKIESMLTEAIEKAQSIENAARDKETNILAEAYRRQEEIIGRAEEEADTIKKTALDEKRDILKAVEGEVVETMITLLQHIISEEINGHVEWLRLVVRRILLQEEINEDTMLLISSNNMIHLEQEKDQFINSLSKLTTIEVSESLNDTTCILVTSQGNIEYDINEGLRKVVSELRILKGLS